MDDAVKKAIERMRVAADKANREALKTSDDRRAHYCDGTTHGLREAIRMLEEELKADRARTEGPANSGATGR